MTKFMTWVKAKIAWIKAKAIVIWKFVFKYIDLCISLLQQPGTTKLSTKRVISLVLVYGFLTELKGMNLTTALLLLGPAVVLMTVAAITKT
jgi:hypothetical protein